VADRTFRPAEAMLLSVVSTWQMRRAADGFIPVDRLLPRVLGPHR